MLASLLSFVASRFHAASALGTYRNSGIISTCTTSVSVMGTWYIPSKVLYPVCSWSNRARHMLNEIVYVADASILCAFKLSSDECLKKGLLWGCHSPELHRTSMIALSLQKPDASNRPMPMRPVNHLAPVREHQRVDIRRHHGRQLRSRPRVMLCAYGASCDSYQDRLVLCS